MEVRQVPLRRLERSVRDETEVHAAVVRVAVERRLGRQLCVVVTARRGVNQVAATLHGEVEVVVAEPTVAVVLLATVLLGDDVGDLLRETEGLTAGEHSGVLREVHVRVVPAVVRLAVAGLVGDGHGEAELAVRAEARVKVVDVPELHDVVLDVEALRKHVLQVGLRRTVEERAPARVRVRERHDVVVDERVGDTLADDVALVAVERQRRRVARVDPRGRRNVNDLSHFDFLSGYG
jgi:hypothetical protein